MEHRLKHGTEHGTEHQTEHRLEHGTEHRMEYQTEHGINTDWSGKRNCTRTKQGTEQQLSLSMLRSEFHFHVTYNRT